MKSPKNPPGLYNVLILYTSPVAGSVLAMIMSANDDEFCVTTTSVGFTKLAVNDVAVSIVRIIAFVF